MDLKERVALVTGGASGIGRAITLELAKNGAFIAINYNSSKTQAEELVNHIIANGGNAIAIKADVSSFEEAENLVKTTVNHFGKLDILVNNAGVTRDGLIMRMKEDQFDDVININLKGVWNTCRHASRYLSKSDFGRIVNISSVSGLVGNVGQSNYTAAKAGVIGLTKTLAREFAGRGVTANVVAPGLIETKMTAELPTEITENFLKNIPLNRFGQPQEIADAVNFLVSDKAKYITGQVLVVDGGMVI
ncbi:MAG TPA: 3-oxoacyl-[acyl-carrier-protein] reductase [Acholeplasmataceae bacterium]|nr:3-oxoacyl-[acyl-carrier-protein] reductase [Acholeplasmataceae bacterium]